MKVLLLGAHGNLGTALMHQAHLQQDHDFIGWDKDDIDVTDKTLLEKKIAELKPDVIINTVAYNDVDGCETEAGAVQAELLNCTVVGFLAEIALEYDCLLIHYSTDYVFSGDTKGGYDENAEPAPLNAYGISKLKGEKELLRLSGRGLRWYLIRTAHLFGKMGKPGYAKPSFFEFILAMTRTSAEIQAIADESGSFTYADDLAVATIRLLESEAGFGVYHLVNEGSASWYSAANYFFKAFKLNNIQVKKISSQSLKRAAKRPHYSQLLNTKRPPLRSWQAAVDEYVKTL